MSERFTRISVDLSRDEFEALRDSASQDYRDIRAQARWLLRKQLGLPLYEAGIEKQRPAAAQDTPPEVTP